MNEKNCCSVEQFSARLIEIARVQFSTRRPPRESRVFRKTRKIGVVITVVWSILDENQEIFAVEEGEKERSWEFPAGKYKTMCWEISENDVILVLEMAVVVANLPKMCLCDKI